jgi:hypothetical protein
VNISNAAEKTAVIPANAGIQVVYLIDFQGGKSYELDSGPGYRHSGVTFLRRNDGLLIFSISSQPLR